MSTKTTPLTDAEIYALSAIAISDALLRASVDAERTRNGMAVAYGDMPIDAAEELRAEMQRRGVLR